MEFKKSIKLLVTFCIAITLFIGGFFLVGNNTNKNEATLKNECIARLNVEDNEQQTTQEEDDNPIIPISLIYENKFDKNMYEQLLFLRDGQYPERLEDAEPLRQNDFIDCEEIDLSKRNLEVVEELFYYFKLDNLKKLNLSGNKLTAIYKISIANIEELEELDVSNNKLKILEFGSLTKLHKLYAQFNSLSKIDLSIMTGEENDKAFANLAQNNFSKINNITIPKTQLAIELYGNSVNDYGDLTKYAPTTINLLIQKPSQKVDDSYAFYVNHSQYRVRVTNTLTSESVFFEQGNNFLKHGEYLFEIFDGDNNLSSDTSKNNIYQSFNVVVQKSAPKFDIFIDGEKISEIEIFNKPITIKFYSNDQEYIIKYKVNGSEFIQSDELVLDKTGNYNILVYGVNGEIQSSPLTMNLIVKISNHRFGTILVVFLCVVGVVVIALLLLWWANTKININKKWFKKKEKKVNNENKLNNE